jgi:hypothetical protein
MAGLELVQAQPAQVRDEMHPHVRLVAAYGVLVDLQAGQPVGEVGGHGRGLGQRHVGPDALADGVEVGQGLAGAQRGDEQVGDLGFERAVVAGEVEQAAGALKLGDGVAVVGEAAAAQLSAVPVGSAW